jgi:ParB family chromosome partitioning protein
VDQYTEIPLDAVEPDSAQPREHFDPVAMQELQDSIQERGLLQPIIVRRSRRAPDRYQIIMGERRWRAHRNLGKPTIKAIVREDEKSDAATFIDQMIENVNRADMTPMEEAAGYQRIIDEHPGWAPGDVARATGKTERMVYARLALNNLVDEFKHLVATGQVKAGTGALLGDLTRAQQLAALVRFGKGEFATDNELLHYAYSVREQGEVTMIVEVYDLAPEERERRAKVKKVSLTYLQRLEAVVRDAASLGDAPTLAEGLGAGVGIFIDRFDAAQKALAKVMFHLRQARALVIAAGAELSGDALPGDPQDVAVDVSA